MPVNKNLNKIRVTRAHGTDVVLGYMDPDLHMQVRFGIDSRWIRAMDTGNFQVSLAKTSGGTEVAKAYPHQLLVDVTVASGYGWPAGGHVVPFTHHAGLRASG